MKFFTEFNVDKAEAIGVTSLLSNITNKPHSHKGGWARLLICQLKNLGYETVKLVEEDDLSDYTCLIFDQGAEFSGGFNLFGGVDEDVCKRLKDLTNFKGQMFSWHHQLPAFTDLVPRIKNPSSCKEFQKQGHQIIARACEIVPKVQIFDHAVKTDKLLLCDSHGPAVWTPEFMIDRRDGRTLRGMIEKLSLKREALRYDWATTFQVCASSIDIRHHVCRTELPEANIRGLVEGLLNQTHKLLWEAITSNLTHTMGIEDESRKLPKTGYYKDTPFCGSWIMRNESRKLFNELLDDHVTKCLTCRVVAYPPVFFDKQGKLRFDVMERPGSVHISPEHYRWDLENNKQRWPW